MARTNNKTVPSEFTIVSRILPLKLSTTQKNVKATRCGRQAGVRFGPGTLLQAKLTPDQRLTLAKLANGMWAVVPDEAGYTLGRANKDATAHIFRVPLLCRFKNEAELLHGMWCFPEETFAPFPVKAPANE